MKKLIKYFLPTLILLGFAGTAYAITTVPWQRINGNTFIPLYTGDNVLIGTSTYPSAFISGQTLLGIQGNFAGYTEANMQNLSSSTTASSNFILTGDNGTASTYYTDFFQNSSGYTNIGDIGGGADDAGIYSSDNSFYVGTASTTNPNANVYLAAQNTIFATGTPTGLTIKNATTTNLTVTGTCTGCGGGTLSGGIIGTNAIWNGTTSIIPSGDMIDNGVVAGVNATSSSFNFNIQATSASPFNVSNSSGNSLFQAQSFNNVQLPMNASSTFTATTVGSTGPVLQLGSTALSAPSANGTYFALNAPSSFTGNLVQLQTNGSNEFSVGAGGNVNAPGNINSTGGNINSNSGSVSSAGFFISTAVGSGLTLQVQSSGVAAGYLVNTLDTSGTHTAASGDNGDLLVGKQVNNFQPVTGNGQWNSIETNDAINQLATANGVTRGLFLNPRLISAFDYRNIETSSTLVDTLSTSTTISTAYNVLFNPITYTSASSSLYNLANASTLNIAGAPIGTTASTTISSSTGITIQGNALTNVTNGYGLYVNAPTGASNNYAALFSTGGMVLGSTINNTASSTGNLSLFHIIGNSPTPTISTSTGVGSTCVTGCSASLDSNTTDLSADVSVTTGGTPSGSSAIFTVAFSKPYGVAPHCIFSPDNAATALLSGVTMTYITESTTGYTMTSGSSGLVGATTYSWTIVCTQ